MKKFPGLTNIFKLCSNLKILIKFYLWSLYNCFGQFFSRQIKTQLLKSWFCGPFFSRKIKTQLLKLWFCWCLSHCPTIFKCHMPSTKLCNLHFTSLIQNFGWFLWGMQSCLDKNISIKFLIFNFFSPLKLTKLPRYNFLYILIVSYKRFTFLKK